jgi:hypothetical protein
MVIFNIPRYIIGKKLPDFVSQALAVGEVSEMLIYPESRRCAVVVNSIQQRRA